MKIELPGAVWSALILGLTGALTTWLNGSLGAYSWAPIAVLALAAVAKAAEIYFTDKRANEVAGRNAVEVTESHKVQRFFLGG